MKRLILFALLLGFSGVRGNEDPYLEAELTGAGYGKSALEAGVPAVTENDLRRYVTRLASAEFEGRGTGDPGERMATAYLAAFLEGVGTSPAGDDGTFFQDFMFRAGMELKGENSLSIAGEGDPRSFRPGDQYEPLSLSSSGEAEAEVVFAGFGIEHESYNSFEGLEVKGKWILVLRGAPSGKAELKRFAPLYVKARLAKKKEAAGILFVKAASSATGPELIPPTISVGPGGAILPAMTISDELAASLLAGEGELPSLFESFDKEERKTGFALPIRIRSRIGLAVDNDPGRNVLGRLVVGAEPSEQVVMIGGHIDHLGFGNRGGTRAKGEDAKKLHPGADDNASGIAVIMELAQYFADQKRSGTLNLDRDIVFVGWSGEEMGLWGSRHYVKEAREEKDKIVYPGIAAYLNLDMVGRASPKGLSLNGTASSKDWKEILDAIPANEGLKIKLVPNPYTPGDASPFYLAGVPVLAAFTGTHDDYHTPRDTVDKIDFTGLVHVTNYVKTLVASLSNRDEAPGYVQVPRKRPGEGAPKVKIGIRMEAAEESGVRVVEVVEGSPANRAGIQVGDIVSSLNGTAVKNPDALFGELRKLKPKMEYPVSVRREGEILELKITPEAR